MVSKKLKLEIYKYSIKYGCDLESILKTAELILKETKIYDNDFVKQYLQS